MVGLDCKGGQGGPIIQPLVRQLVWRAPFCVVSWLGARAFDVNAGQNQGGPHSKL